MVWSNRGHINTAALVTILLCNSLVAQCYKQLIGPADWVFVTGNSARDSLPAQSEPRSRACVINKRSSRTNNQVGRTQATRVAA